MDLFKKDIFSAGSPIFTKLNAQDTAPFELLIKKYYPLNEIFDVHKIGAIEINSNNWKVSADKGDFILKRAEIHKSAALTAQAEWTAALEKKGFPTVQFLTNKNGRLMTQDGDYIYCLTYFKEGIYFGSDLNQWGDLVTNSRVLFNYALQDNTPVSSDIPSRVFFTPEEEILINKLRSLPSIQEISPEQLSILLKEYDSLKENFLSQKNTLHRKIFHVDLHPHNLIYNKNNLTLFTDFESYQLTSIEISLGFGLYKCIRQLLSMEEYTNEAELTKPLQNLKADFLFKFPDHNLGELIALGKIDVVKRILYILHELLENGQSKWLFILKTQLVSIEEINTIKKILES